MKQTVGIVIINQADRILALWHNKCDAVSIPSGGVDEGETVMSAAIRELQEETGLEVTASQLELVETKVYNYPSGNQAEHNLFVLDSKVLDNNLPINAEPHKHEWLHFVTFDEMNSFNLTNYGRDALIHFG